VRGTDEDVQGSAQADTLADEALDYARPDVRLGLWHTSDRVGKPFTPNMVANRRAIEFLTKNPDLWTQVCFADGTILEPLVDEWITKVKTPA
jgi:hypothetical protein